MIATELHRKLIADFIGYYEFAKKTGWGSWPFRYYGGRAGLSAACVANLPGTKFAISSDTTDKLLDQIRKALLFSDHVVIRHQTLLPSKGGHVCGDGPFLFPSFGLEEFIESHKEELEKLPVLPHVRSFPGDKNDAPARKFLSWLVGEGRSWAEHGLVTYAPFIFPENVDIACAQKNVNINEKFREFQIIPCTSSRVDEKAAAALQLLEMPYLANVDPEILLKVKSDNQDAVACFRGSLLKAFQEIDSQVGTDSFQREVQTIFDDIVRKGVADVHKGLKRAEKMRALKQRTVFATTCLIGLSFWLGAPAFVVAGALSKPIWDFVNAILQGRKEKEAAKDKPMYVLAALSGK